MVSSEPGLCQICAGGGDSGLWCAAVLFLRQTRGAATHPAMHRSAPGHRLIRAEMLIVLRLGEGACHGSTGEQRLGERQWDPP